MIVLLIEDDDAKRELIVRHLRSRDDTIMLVEATSFRGALTTLGNVKPDLVLLDMSIPSFDADSGDGDRPLVYGGRDVLRQMRRLGIAAPVIVITQYERFGEGPDALSLPELDQQLHAVYPEVYRGAVAFSFIYDTWKRELDERLANVTR